MCARGAAWLWPGAMTRVWGAGALVRAGAWPYSRATSRRSRVWTCTSPMSVLCRVVMTGRARVGFEFWKGFEINCMWEKNRWWNFRCCIKIATIKIWFAIMNFANWLQKNLLLWVLLFWSLLFWEDPEIFSFFFFVFGYAEGIMGEWTTF